MSVFLVVKIVDVTEQPVDGAAVKATIGAADLPLTATVNPGIQEAAIPDGSAKLTVSVSLKGFFEVKQDLLLDASGEAPILNFEVDQEINIRNIAVTVRGSDFNAEVHVVLGQIRDASELVLDADTQGQLATIAPTDINHIGTPILNPAGKGKDLVNKVKSQVVPGGTLFFVERVGTPRLIAIFHPGFPNPATEDQEKQPLPYHLFFHPFIPWVDKYPFGPDYLDLIARYVVEPVGEGKAMAHQNVADGPKNIFVFPVGSLAQQMGTLNSETNVQRLLQEINYWIQRKLGVPFPRQPVGPCALSCFSAGARFLSAVLQGPRNADFHDRLLKHIFIFDGVFDGANGAAETSRFCKAMIKWHRNGDDGRTYRVYTQSGLWFQELLPDLPGAVITKGPGGAKEADSPTGTLFFNPASFWRFINPNTDYFDIHQLIPAVFMEHAVTNSSFKTDPPSP